MGGGKIFGPNDGFADITILYEFILSDYVDQIEKIVTSTYPNLIQNYKDFNFQKVEPF